MQMLLKSVSVAFQNAVNAEKLLLESYLNVNRPRFDPEAIPARNRYLNRRIKLIEGIVKWRKYTEEKFGLGDVVKRIVDEILIPVAEGGWEVGGEQCLRKVSFSILDYFAE
jgi:GC-rich sequence DNA-binding factor